MAGPGRRPNAGGGNVNSIAELLFTKYLFAFELTSALLITAAVGAMVLAHIERDARRAAQPAAAVARADALRPAAAAAGPGRASPPRDSIATPALLPDGTRRAGDRSCRLVDEPLTPAERSGPTDPGCSRWPVDRGAASRGASDEPDLLPGAVRGAVHIGAVGVLVRRNAIVVFMCIELMLNAVNLTLVTFARINGTLDGQVIAFFVMVVAAAEVVVGLAIIMSIFRTRRSASVDDANLLKY